MPVKTIVEYTEYFRKIATELIPISHLPSDSHFVPIHSAALFNGVQYNVDDRVFFLEQYSVEMIGDADSLVQRVSGAFSICKYVDSSGNYEQSNEIIAWAEKLCKEVLGRIRYDVEMGFLENVRFDFNSVEMLPLSQRPLNYCGMRVAFNYDVADSFCYNESNWQSFLQLANGDYLLTEDNQLIPICEGNNCLADEAIGLETGGNILFENGTTLLIN